MPKYFFVVRHGDQTDHSDGIEFPDISAVQLVPFHRDYDSLTG
jgi:hypothetical protein